MAALLLLLAFEPVQINGEAMSPTLRNGDTVVIGRLAYVADEPKVGDIVAFHADISTVEGENGLLIKRIAGVAGDTIVSEDGKREVVKKGYVYVLGDNRRLSLDSRSDIIGQVPVTAIKGRVSFGLSPFGSLKGIRS